MTSGRMTCEVQPQRVELGDVGGEGVALAGLVGLDDVVQLGEFPLLVLHVVGAEIVGEVEFRGGRALHADFAVVEVERGIDVARARQHEALAVVIGDRREIQVIVLLTRHAPGRVAGEDVDLAALQLLEAFAGVERNELGLARIVENLGGDRAAEIDVEADPVALVVVAGEAGQSLVDAAQHLAAADGALQRAGFVAFIGDGGGSDQDGDREPDQQAASKCAHD
jgi:hypothetical protein